VRVLIVTLIALACALGSVPLAQAAGTSTSGGTTVKAGAPKAKRAHHGLRKHTARPAAHHGRTTKATKAKSTRSAPARTATGAASPRA
jgi:hypothetical protein